MGFYCVICSDSLIKTPVDDVQNAGQEAKVSAVPCGHFFHDYCISKWLKGTMPTSKQCPCCRKDVPKGRCLPLFPNILDDSILDDSSTTVPCDHEPILRELRLKNGNLERRSSELETMLKNTTEDLESQRSKLLTEKRRSEKYMFQCQLKESLELHANNLEAQLSEANNKLKVLQSIQQCVDASSQEIEEELDNWPLTQNSIQCLVDMKVVLARELKGQEGKVKEISRDRERIKNSNRDLLREIQKLKKHNEELHNQNSLLKIKVEALSDQITPITSCSEVPEKSTSFIPKRKRPTNASPVVDNSNSGNYTNPDDSVIILTPEVDRDIGVLQPFHNNKSAPNKISPLRKTGTKSANDLTAGSSKPTFTFKKKTVSQSSSQTISDNIQTTASKSNLKSYSALSKSKEKVLGTSSTSEGNLAFLTSATSSKSDMNKNLKRFNFKDSNMDVELSPLDFQANIKSSLPGLTNTPIGQMASSRFQPRAQLSKRPKVLQKQ